MKKLKKGLSLLLVLAMVFSLASTAFAWETNYEDDDQIVQKEAVEVLSAMGIIEGDNGKFDPTGNFTREQAAKIVTYMVLGPETAESLQITANDFSDVAATRWSAKYIAYAASQDIVMGDGNGKFRPADNVSRIEWLKMLLVSLGVDPDANGLGDDPNWAANTQSLAVRSGLVTGKELGLDWNRDTAVLYAFNAMKLAQDSSWQRQYVSNDDDHYRFVRQYAPTLYKVTESGIEGTTAKIYNDEYGRSYTAWADSYIAKGATIYAKDYDEPVATYENKGVTLADLTKDLGIESTTNIAVVNDGNTSSISYATASGTFTDNTVTVGGLGSVVEVYKNENGSYKILVINTYVAVVGTIAKDATTVTLTAKKADGTTTETTAIASVEGLTKGDIVSFNKGAALGTSKVTAYNVTKLEGTAVKVTATGTDKVGAYARVDGEKVYASKYVSKDANTAATTAAISNVKTGTFYYDSYGNVIYFEKTSVSVAKAVDGYFYVESVESKAGTDGASVNSLLGLQAAQAKAQVINLTTGAESVVDLGIVLDDKNATESARGYYYANKYGEADSTKVQNTNSYSAGFYGYYLLDDGTYVLETLTTPTPQVAYNVTSSFATEGTTIVNKGQATLTGVSGAYSDANTKLTVLTPNTAPATGYTVTTVTGIANFSKIESEDNATKVFAITSGANITEIVIMYSAAPTDSKVDSKTYALYTAKGDEATDDAGNATYDYTFILNDDEVTYTAKRNTVSSLEGNDKTGKVYTLTTTGAFAATPVSAAYYDLTYNASSVATVKTITDTYIVVTYKNGSGVDTDDLVYLNENCQTASVRPDSDGLVVGATVNVYKSDVTGLTDQAMFIVVQ